MWSWFLGGPKIQSTHHQNPTWSFPAAQSVWCCRNEIWLWNKGLRRKCVCAHTTYCSLRIFQAFNEMRSPLYLFASTILSHSAYMRLYQNIILFVTLLVPGCPLLCIARIPLQSVIRINPFGNQTDRAYLHNVSFAPFFLFYVPACEQSA